MAQDPYPYKNQADGLAFSTNHPETPASLRMIFRELDRDVLKTTTYEEFSSLVPSNSLTNWAKKGIFLINSQLTVRAGEPNSHSHLGWSKFTGHCLQLLWEDTTPKVFCLWGADARNTFEKNINLSPNAGALNHLVLETGHPASGSHGKDMYSGNGHFSKINNFFRKRGLPEINWTLNDN